MRALIRINPEPEELFRKLWTTKDIYNKRTTMSKYYEKVIDLFKDMGYPPRKIWSDNLKEDKTVGEIFEDVPKDIRSQEEEHLIMLGYTSEGQAYFIVSAINPDEIHIRVKAPIFQRIRSSCEDINNKIIKFNKKNRYRKDRINIKSIIHVMEPHRDNPTIMGEIIKNPFRETLTQNITDATIAAVSLAIFITLFFTAPDIASHISNIFKSHVLDQKYIQGALERIYSALMVSFFITGFGIIVKSATLKKFSPIKWDSFSAPSRK